METREATRDALNVLELRRYALRSGRRDDLIALFEREFIEGQEACGMLPIGHYRNLDAPDEFVWFRGFSDMASRRRALEAFYVRSDVWRAHRNAANETMIDSDNVLLLRPASTGRGFDLQGLQRPSLADSAREPSLVGVAVLLLRQPLDAQILRQFETGTLADLERFAQRITLLETEAATNDFRLPVREGEWALAVAGVCRDEFALASFLRALEVERLPRDVRANVIGAEYLRLEPAARCLYR